MNTTHRLAQTLWTTTLVAFSAAAHADITLVRQGFITPSVFGGTDKMTSTISVKDGKTRMEEHNTLIRDGKERWHGAELSITDADSKQGYYFNPSRHTYSVYPYRPGISVMPGMKDPPPATVTALPGSKTFLGHSCRGYHIVKSNPSIYYTTVTADVYVATDLPPIDVFSQHGGPIWEAADAFQRIGGTPLHMDMTAIGRDKRQATFTVDVTSFSTKLVRDNVFSIPKGYTLVPPPPPPAAYHAPDTQSTQGKDK